MCRKNTQAAEMVLALQYLVRKLTKRKSEYHRNDCFANQGMHSLPNRKKGNHWKYTLESCVRSHSKQCLLGDTSQGSSTLLLMSCDGQLSWSTQMICLIRDADLRPSKLQPVRGCGLVVCNNCRRRSETDCNDSVFDNGYLH